MQKFDVIRVHDIIQLRVLIGSSGHFMPKRSWILPSDETIQIPSFLDELRASLCKILISSFAHKIDFAHNFPVDFGEIHFCKIF